MYKSIIFSLACITFFWDAQAQSISLHALSNGGHFHQGDAQMSWTTGQLLIATFHSDSLWLTQGFHQPQTVVTTAKQPLAADQPHLALYPNPARHYVSLMLQPWPAGDILLKIYGSHGQQLRSRQLPPQISPVTLSLKGLPPGPYHIQVIHPQWNRSYTLIKN